MFGIDNVCSEMKREGTINTSPHGELVLWLLPSLLRTPDEDNSLQALQNKCLLGLAAHTRKQMEFSEPASQQDFLGDNFLKTQ